MAGDRILFEGGQSFSGSLSFDAGDAGSAPNPITISSFGSGRATINAGSAYGLYAYNTAGLTISRLDFIGPGASSSTGAGITFYNELAGNVRLAHVHLDDVDVSGFRRGVSIGGWNGTSGYDDVRVTNSALHDNQRSGMTVYAQNRYGVTDVYVAGCAFYDNLGDPNDTTSNSGNGIVLGQVDGAVIERSLAWNNGQLCTAPEGPIGIWAYESTDVTIQLCESWSNRTGGSADGGGFGFDGGTTASVLQYNYSHDNDGAAFGLYQYGGAPAWGANVVRYNISENDGRKNGYGAINVWNGGTGMSGCEIYGNTIYTSPAPPNTPHAVRISTTVSNFHFRNNILMAVGGARLFAAPQGLSGLALQGNDYFTAGGAFTIAYAGTTYTTLGAFVAATGHEKVGATVVGRNVDPLLTFAGNGGTVADPDLLAALPAYKLTSASPLVDGGLDLTGLFGLAPGPRDFFAMSLPEGGGFDVGAHEFHAPGAACDGQGDPDMDGDGICDADDTCPDTPDPAQADGDGDAVGDACDPCTNSAPTSVAKPRVLVSGLNSGESDDKLKISASIHGVPSLPSIDPAANGLRILALSATGESVIDAMIPGGAYDPLTRAGWTTAPSGLVWKYSNAGTAVPLAGGISRVVIKAIAKTPGLYKVSIMGADADYDAATDLPLLPVVVLDPPFARDGQCAEMHFDGPAPLPSCSLVSQGNAVKCR